MKTGDDWRKVETSSPRSASGSRIITSRSSPPTPKRTPASTRCAALRTLGDALDHVFTAVGLHRDPALKSEAKEAAGAIAPLGATFTS